MPLSLLLPRSRYRSFAILAHPSQDGMSRNTVDRERKDERMRPKKGELHELPDAEIVQSWTITIDSPKLKCSLYF